MKNKMVVFSGYGLFWSWNLIITMLTIFLLFPEMIIPILTGVITGSVFIEQGIFSILIFFVPFISIVLGLTKRFRKNPSLLLKLFYGVELPLFFLIIARLTIFRELHPGTIHILALSLLAVMAYSWTIFIKNEKHSSVLMTTISQVLITCSFILVIYIALFLLLFLLPMGKEFLIQLFQFEWFVPIFEHPLIFLSMIFIFYTFTLLLGLPLMLIILYSRTFINNSRYSIDYFGQAATVIVVILTITINGLIFYWANQQDQEDAFVLLEEPVKDDQQKRRLLEKQDMIRKGLVNAYLASYRYLSAEKTNNIIEHLYADSFAMAHQGFPRVLQSAFNYMASPFLYQGGRWSTDSIKAERFYLEFFDTPIEKAESKAINQALKSNWYRDGMQAGLINKDRQKVLITKQSVSIQEKTHSASITLNETYQNQTFEQQEIYYYFSLPEEAVLTGLWLSDDADNPQKYAYTVAPRGAAQKIYLQERERRVDPALLEQIGPMQYRLRVFPIPAKRKQHKQLTVEVDVLLMQLVYDIPLNKNHQWILPRLLEKRNVFWNNNSELMINGQVYQRPKKADKSLWLPSFIMAESATPLERETTQILLNEEQILNVKIESRANQIQNKRIFEQFFMTRQSIAILIDTSFSMNRVKQILLDTLEQLDSMQQSPQLDIEFFTIGNTASEVRHIRDWINKKPIFFGHNTTIKQLNQWQQLTAKEKQYDVLILLTDQGNYEVKEKQSSFSIRQVVTQTPLWILHLGNEAAYAYADQLLDYIYQSGGGVGYSLNEVIERISWKQQRNNHQLSAISQNYIWHYDILDKPVHFSIIPDDLSAIIAHQWISTDFNRHNASQLDALDSLHFLAKNNSLVSPFSSMIVLINQRQKKALEKISVDKERFNRAIDSGAKSIVKGHDLFAISSVPEPEEWALIIVILFILSLAIIKRQQAQRRVLF